MGDVEVIWNGLVIGHLRGVVIDMPHYGGRWEPNGVPAFEEAFRAAQAALSKGEVSIWEAGFRSSDGVGRITPVQLLIFSERAAPRFRMVGRTSPPSQ